MIAADQQVPESKIHNIIQQIQRCNEEACAGCFQKPVEGRKKAARAYELSISGPFERENYLQGLADSLMNLSHYNYLLGKMNTAIKQAEHSMQLYQSLGQLQPQAELYGRLGSIYEIYNNRILAIEYLVKGLEIAKSNNFELIEGKISLRIAEVYFGMGNFRQCIHDATQAEIIFKKYGHPILTSFALICISQANAELHQMEKAFQTIYQALDLSTENDSLIARAEGLYSLGLLHLMNNELPLAQTHLQYCKDMTRKSHLRLLNVRVNLGLSEILLRSDEPKEALRLLKKCLKDAEEIGIEQNIVQAHYKLAEGYERLHLYKLSLDHFKIYNEITNKIFDQQSLQKIQTIEVLYRTRAATREAELTRSKNLELEKEIVNRKQIEAKLRKNEKRYRSLASVDSLTRLYNRRHFFDVAEIEFERAFRYQHPLSLMMIDLDHFKKINDCYGHLIGDEMLKFVATICKNNLRKMDIIGRYGGEEFIVLLPGTKQDDAFILAERIVHTIANSRLSSIKGSIQITASIGVSTKMKECKQLDTLVEMADRALYSAKQLGRNQVVMAPDVDLKTGEPE
jgi:diguanylate cyclase (GGDEF)-like protein